MSRPWSLFFFTVVVVERSNVVLGARGDEPIRQKGSAKGGVGGTAARASSVMGGATDQHVSERFIERIVGASLGDFDSRNRLFLTNSIVFQMRANKKKTSSAAAR